MAKLTKVALLLNLQIGYDRQAAYGVKDFVGNTRPWLVRMLAGGAGEPGIQAAVDFIRDWKPDGVIMRVNSWPLANAVLPLGKPIVNVSSVNSAIPCPRVNPDNVAVGAAAAKHLLERSLRHFACIVHGDSDNSRQRFGGFQSALLKAGHTCQRLQFELKDEEEPAVEQFLHNLPKPVGLYCDMDALGLRVSEMCREMELRVPEQIALVSTDNDDLSCTFAQPPMSSVDMNARKIGYEAAALLDRLMAGKPAPAAPILIQPLGVAARPSSDILAVDDVEVATAVRFIRDNAGGAIGVEDVLQQVPISRRWLERRFRRALGRSPLDEIRRVRIDRAKELLAHTDLPMPDVAGQCGFSSSARLSIVFAAETGLTPMGFRKQFRLGSGGAGGKLKNGESKSATRLARVGVKKLNAGASPVRSDSAEDASAG